jgi:hypothetical protein
MQSVARTQCAQRADEIADDRRCGAGRSSGFLSGGSFRFCCCGFVGREPFCQSRTGSPIDSGW